MLERVIETSFVLIMAYLILQNAAGFSSVASSAGVVFVNAAKTLQGR